MDGDHGAFSVPDFWRTSAFSLSDTLEESLFTATQFGESDALPISCWPTLTTAQNCP